MPCLRISVNRLREGMIIREDVFSKTGAVIVPDGAVVTRDVAALLTRHFVDGVMVEYPAAGKGREAVTKRLSVSARPAMRLQSICSDWWLTLMIPLRIAQSLPQRS